MAINQIQVPNYAATVQGAFDRKDRLDENRVSAAATQAQGQKDLYLKGRDHILTGLQKMEDLKKQSPDGSLPEMAEFRKTLETSAATFDQMGQQLGYPPMLRELAGSVFDASPTGTQAAQNEGFLAATKGNAQTANTDFAAQGMGEGMKTATASHQAQVMDSRLGTSQLTAQNNSAGTAAGLRADAQNNVPGLQGRNASLQTGAELRNNQMTGVPAMRGQNAAAQGNMQVTEEARLGTPMARGVNTANEKTGEITQSWTNGMPAQQAALEVKTRAALSAALMDQEGVDPTSDEGRGLHRTIMGMDRERYTGSVLNLAIDQAGLTSKVMEGVALSEDEMVKVETIAKRFGASSENLAAAFASILGAAPTTARPRAASGKGGETRAEEIARLKKELDEGG